VNVHSVTLREFLTILGQVWIAGMEMVDPEGVNSEAAVDMGMVDTEAAVDMGKVDTEAAVDMGKVDTETVGNPAV
jgi:hypothetical protein